MLHTCWLCFMAMIVSPAGVGDDVEECSRVDEKLWLQMFNLAKVQLQVYTFSTLCVYVCASVCVCVYV